MSSIPVTPPPANLPERLRMVLADEVTRADVVVTRKGWIEHKTNGDIIGLLTQDKNAVGEPLWRANVSDQSVWAFGRNDCIENALNLHNQQERSRAYRLLVRLLGGYDLTKKAAA